MVKLPPLVRVLLKNRELALAAFSIRATDKGEFVYIEKTIPGRPTAEILTELIPQWITRLEGKTFYALGRWRFKISPANSLVINFSGWGSFTPRIN
ncbi:MAG UNVERIFIED_CONTAM: hypothetical protein LVR29_27915 [Microcystis novacekii LVE1205-3]|jgi:glycyl-tRNA synthetase beta subunit